MSLTLTLVPLAIAINASVAASFTATVGIAAIDGGCDTLPAVKTTFSDPGMLVKTLQEHGLEVNQVSENEFVIQAPSGILHYFRQSSDSPFLLEVKKVKNLQELLDSLDSLENEYGRNVQKFTYDRVMASLEEHGMSVENEEILEDDSILLTLNT